MIGGVTINVASSPTSTLASYVVQLQATITHPLLQQRDTTEKHFGRVAVGFEGRHTFAIRNTSDVTDVAFRIPKLHCCSVDKADRSGSVPRGSSKTVSFTMRSMSSGHVSETITVINDTTEQHPLAFAASIACSGDAVVCNTTSLIFPCVAVTWSAVEGRFTTATAPEQAVTITNNTSHSVVLAMRRGSCPVSIESSSTAQRGPIAIGKNSAAVVRCVISDTPSFTAKQIAALRGYGEIRASHELPVDVSTRHSPIVQHVVMPRADMSFAVSGGAVSPAVVDLGKFGNADAGQRFELTFTNLSTVLPLHVSSSQKENFFIVPPIRVAPAATATFSIELQSIEDCAEGRFAQQLSFVNDFNPANSLEVAVSGTRVGMLWKFFSKRRELLSSAGHRTLVLPPLLVGDDASSVCSEERLSISTGADHSSAAAVSVETNPLVANLLSLHCTSDHADVSSVTLHTDDGQTELRIQCNRCNGSVSDDILALFSSNEEMWVGTVHFRGLKHEAVRVVTSYNAVTTFDTAPTVAVVRHPTLPACLVGAIRLRNTAARVVRVKCSSALQGGTLSIRCEPATVELQPGATASVVATVHGARGADTDLIILVADADAPSSRCTVKLVVTKRAGDVPSLPKMVPLEPLGGSRLSLSNCTASDEGTLALDLPPSGVRSEPLQHDAVKIANRGDVAIEYTIAISQRSPWLSQAIEDRSGVIGPGEERALRLRASCARAGSFTAFVQVVLPVERLVIKVNHDVRFDGAKRHDLYDVKLPRGAPQLDFDTIYGRRMSDPLNVDITNRSNDTELNFHFSATSRLRGDSKRADSVNATVQFSQERRSFAPTGSITVEPGKTVRLFAYVVVNEMSDHRSDVVPCESDLMMKCREIRDSNYTIPCRFTVGAMALEVTPSRVETTPAGNGLRQATFIVANPTDSSVSYRVASHLLSAFHISPDAGEVAPRGTTAITVSAAAVQPEPIEEHCFVYNADRLSERYLVNVATHPGSEQSHGQDRSATLSLPRLEHAVIRLVHGIAAVLSATADASMASPRLQPDLDGERDVLFACQNIIDEVRYCTTENNGHGRRFSPYVTLLLDTVVAQPLLSGPAWSHVKAQLQSM
jgi:hypothetical protein